MNIVLSFMEWSLKKLKKQRKKTADKFMKYFDGVGSLITFFCKIFHWKKLQLKYFQKKNNNNNKNKNKINNDGN